MKSSSPLLGILPIITWSRAKRQYDRVSEAQTSVEMVCLSRRSWSLSTLCLFRLLLLPSVSRQSIQHALISTSPPTHPRPRDRHAMERLATLSCGVVVHVAPDKLRCSRSSIASECGGVTAGAHSGASASPATMSSIEVAPLGPCRPRSIIPYLLRLPVQSIFPPLSLTPSFLFPLSP